MKILLAEYRCKVEYIICPPQLDEMMKRADAALLIGDDALYWKDYYSTPYQYDLGEEWYVKTELPMVFAVGAIRKEAVINNLNAANYIHNLYLESKKIGILNIDIIIKRCAEEMGKDFIYWEAYFKGLFYDLNVEFIKGMRKFIEMACMNGLLEKNVELEFLSNYTKKGLYNKKNYIKE